MRDDRLFLAACVEKQPYFWYQLHDDIKNDLTLVRSINIEKLNGDHGDEILDMCQRHETLVHDGDFWKGIIAALDYNLAFLFKHLPLHGLNRDLVLQASRKELAVLRYADPSLLHDKEFVKATFSPAFRCKGIQNARLQWSMTRRYESSNLRIVTIINPDFWRDKSFLEAWLRSGGPFLQRLF